MGASKEEILKMEELTACLCTIENDPVERGKRMDDFVKKVIIARVTVLSG